MVKPSGASNGASVGAPEVKGCTIKILPTHQWESAAALAVEQNPANAPMVQMLARDATKSFSPSDLSVLTSKYWGAAGVNLTVSFLDEPEAALRTRILSHMNAWGVFANVQFHEVASGGQVRIARFTPSPDDGFWSYLGTDILSIPANEPTMNLQDFDMSTPESEFFRVIRHETGHTLGFPHEHMLAGIISRIDRKKAIAYFMRTQGWSEQDVIDQVLTPLPNSALITTAAPDGQSIMCYPLPAFIMEDGVAVPGGTDINALDGQFAARLYPKFPVAG